MEGREKEMKHKGLLDELGFFFHHSKARLALGKWGWCSFKPSLCISSCDDWGAWTTQRCWPQNFIHAGAQHVLHQAPNCFYLPEAATSEESTGYLREHP